MSTYTVIIRHGVTPTGIGIIFKDVMAKLEAISSCCGYRFGVDAEDFAWTCGLCGSRVREVASGLGDEIERRMNQCELDEHAALWVEKWTGLKNVEVSIE